LVTGFEGEKLKNCAEEFLAGEHAARAVEFGWTEMELSPFSKGTLVSLDEDVTPSDTFWR
jgi:hypothetical protein